MTPGITTEPAPSLSRRLSHRKAGPLLGMAPATIARADVRRRLGIPTFRIGRRIWYLEAELMQWLADQHRNGHSA